MRTAKGRSVRTPVTVRIRDDEAGGKVQELLLDKNKKAAARVFLW